MTENEQIAALREETARLAGENARLKAEVRQLREDIAYVTQRDLTEIAESDVPARVWHAFVGWRHVVQFLRRKHAVA